MATTTTLRNEPARSWANAAVLTLALLTIVAGPLSADWIVTVDGARIETDGPWAEKGKMVVFTNAEGTLMSLRLSEVDLEASRSLTAEMKRPPSAAATPDPASRPSVFKLTDADVDHVDDAEYFAATAQADAADSAETTGAAEEAIPLIDVVAWDRTDAPSGDGLAVRATITNQGQDVAVSIVVNVALYDEEGRLIANNEGQLASSGLAPGQQTDLVANFPGVVDFTAIDFDITQQALKTRPASEAPVLGETTLGEEPDAG